MASLQGHQQEFKDWLAQRHPNAEVIREFQLVSNAVVVERNGVPPGQLRRGPGVADVQPVALYQPAMNTSAHLINSQGLWDLVDGGRIVTLRTHDEMKRTTYGGALGMVKILSSVVVLLVLVTALGIVGLTSFSVSQRRRQIGTRRALGATRQDILRYFLLENWMVTTMGLVLGAALTFGLNYWMVNEFSLARIDWRYVPAGMLALWVLGQLAAFLPARRAAMIPPALATRTV